MTLGSKSGQTRWLAVAAAILAGVTAGFAYGKMPPALPLLREEMRLSLVQAGWLASAFHALAAVSAIFFGVFSDRVGAFRFCLFGVASIVAGGLLGALAPGAAFLVASRLVEGLGFIAIIVSAPGLIAAATAPARRNLAFGLWATYMPLGSAVVIAVSPLMLDRSGWRGLWVLVAVAAAACGAMLVSQSRRYAGVRSGTRRSLAGIRASLAQPVPWLLGLCFAMYTIQYNAVLIWLPTYLMETRGTGGGAAAAVTALFVFANCFGNVSGGWLVQRNVPRGRIIIATFAMTTLLFLGIFSGAIPDGARYALVLAYSVITGTIPAVALSGGARYARSAAEVGTIQGLIVQLTSSGVFLGPPLVAAAVTWSGSWDAALWVILAAAMIGLCGGFAVGRYEKAAKPA